jgi:type I restriction enzyme M protein
LDAYDVYEQLMTYWHSTMHDDVFLVMDGGWVRAAEPRKTIEDKERKLSETPDLVIGSGKNASKYKMDLIPPGLVAKRFFAAQQDAVDDLTALAEEATRVVDEYAEEHAVDEGLLASAMDDNKVTKGLATARLKEAKQEGSDPDEVAALERVIELFSQEATAKKTAKGAQADLDLSTLKKYGDLSETEIKQLVIDDKWYASVRERIVNEVNSLTRALVDRIQELGQRYVQTLAVLGAKLETLDSRVAAHLTDMGVS